MLFSQLLKNVWCFALYFHCSLSGPAFNERVITLYRSVRASMRHFNRGRKLRIIREKWLLFSYEIIVVELKLWTLACKNEVFLYWIYRIRNLPSPMIGSWLPLAWWLELLPLKFLDKRYLIIDRCDGFQI